jgi:hypothetical protein
MMRRSLVGLIVVGATPFVARSATAELVLNFPLKGDNAFSRQASAALLYGATQILAAIQMAEIDRDKASSNLKEGLSYLEKARQMFAEVQKRAGSAPLNPEKMKLLKEAVARIVSTHKITMPKTMDELSQLAMSEVNRFMAATKEMGFDSTQRARSTTLTFSAAINRLLDVGVLVSELADTAENK